jgi:FkbH-like protein
MSARPELVPAPGRGRIKCVVWDLDDTLWDGVLVEDGDVAVRSEVVAAIRTLDQRGILQSVASRNDRAVAMERLEALGLAEYFLYPQISWNSKSDAIATIAREINIALDTIAFVDDQPFELEEVAFVHPEVLGIPADAIAGMLDAPELTPRFITDESRRRREMYRGAIRRDRAEQDFTGDNHEFLRTLEMLMTIAPAAESDLQRAEELTIRTNQLNSTGLTYSYAELDRYRRSPDHLLLVAGLTDRYGAYGKIGLALIERGSAVWRLKLLLMSCRVMSRGVGNVMLHEIVRLAGERGCALEAEFAETGRNRMMYVTYRFAGFDEVRRAGEVAILRADPERMQATPAYLRLEVAEIPR